MANTVKEVIKVEELSKFGFKVGQEYVNFSKQISEADKAKVVPGVSFEAELYVADSGKRYLNKVLNLVSQSTTPINIQYNISKTVKATPKAETKVEAKNEVMTKAEWADKDLRISRQGCIQAAVRAVATFSTPEDLFSDAERLANQMLEFVNGK